MVVPNLSKNGSGRRDRLPVVRGVGEGCGIDGRVVRCRRMDRGRGRRGVYAGGCSVVSHRDASAWRQPRRIRACRSWAVGVSRQLWPYEVPANAILVLEILQSGILLVFSVCIYSFFSLENFIFLLYLFQSTLYIFIQI